MGEQTSPELETGLLQIAPGMDIVSFLQFDGKAAKNACSHRNFVL
jgi:hypothetical protein